MYTPKQFEQTDIASMHELMRCYPLASLVTLASDGLNANHIPLHLTEAPKPYGTLRGHIARANPLRQDYSQAIDVLSIFHGPDTYISPSWYASKQEHGKVVPTWNYAVVHAYGSLRVIDDPAWLRTQLETLTDNHEASFPQPWQVTDAPAGFIDKMITAIIGIEISITRLEGKWKVNQNQPAENKTTVINNLKETGRTDAVHMAGMITAQSENTK